MAELNHINYSHVEKAYGGDGPAARAAWADICAAGEFGDVPREHAGGLDLSGVSEKAKKTITDLLKPEAKK